MQVQGLVKTSLKLTNCLLGASGVASALFGASLLGTSAVTPALLSLASSLLPALVAPDGEVPEAEATAATTAGGEAVVRAELQGMREFLDKRDKERKWCDCPRAHHPLMRSAGGWETN